VTWSRLVLVFSIYHFAFCFTAECQFCSASLKVRMKLHAAKRGWICDCCQQAEKTEDARVEQLLAILERRPDTDLPKFCEALKETRQLHIVDILLKKKGLNARAAIIILSQHENRDTCVACMLVVSAPNCQRLCNLSSQVCIFLFKLLNIFELMQ